MNWDASYLLIALQFLGWAIFAVVVALSMILNLLGLFGNWLLLFALAVIWAWSGFVHFGSLGMGGIVLLALIGEILETLLAGYGARKFGGSRGSIIAALIGCLAGAVFGTPFIPIPLLGTVLGACIGAFLGAALYDYIQHERKAHEAAWIGFGAAIGKVGGSFAKFICGILILGLAILTW